MTVKLVIETLEANAALDTLATVRESLLGILEAKDLAQAKQIASEALNDHYAD